MPRVVLTPQGVVDAALAVVEASGPDALTLAAVAQQAGVAAPSLYKHVGGLAELRTLLGAQVLRELTAEFTAAVLGRGGDDAVVALMRAYRDYVTRHPARYALMPVDPLHSDSPAQVEAGTTLLQVSLAVLRGYGLADAEAVHVARCLRAMTHGFASIEVAGGFGLPEDLDESYEYLIRMCLAGIPRS